VYLYRIWDRGPNRRKTVNFSRYPANYVVIEVGKRKTGGVGKNVPRNRKSVPL